MVSTKNRPFLICGSCRRSWQSWDEFVADPQLRLLGLQAVIRTPDANALVFEHRCGSSVSVLARRLRHLLPAAPADWTSLAGTERCPGHCRSLADLDACEMPCSNARDRDLIKLVLRIQRDRDNPPA